MSGPTSEMWIDPWVEYLQSKGLTLLLNTELVKFNIINNEITSCIVKQSSNKIQQVKADDYILAINPFNAEQVFKNSQMVNLYKQHYLLNKNTTSNQVSFRLGLDKKITFPIQHIAFVMSDSEFNITWYPQEKHWNKKIQLDYNGNIQSLWSGTIIQSYNKGTLYNKKGINLTKKELIDEIKYQILRSKSFQKLIYDNNNFYITKKDIVYEEIWYEWNYDGQQLQQNNKKWVNNIYNEKYRPLQQTQYSNLFLSGAHTKTSINIWSMEGAVESGKLTSNQVLKKYNKKLATYFKHDDIMLVKPIQYIDDFLYNIGLPNIIDTSLILTICIILYLIIKYNKNVFKYIKKVF